MARRTRLVTSGTKSSTRETIESILWAVALAMAIRTFLVAPFKIPSGSMRPTLIEGDRILVNKFLYRFREPQRGDVVVFRFPENPKRPFIKRLIGMDGDHLEIREGRILINGEVLSGGLPATSYYYNQGPFGQEENVVDVPPEAYFVLGDNSAASHDSRFWGFVPRRLVIGKAICIFWPPSRIRAIR